MVEVGAGLGELLMVELDCLEGVCGTSPVSSSWMVDVGTGLFTEPDRLEGVRGTSSSLVVSVGTAFEPDRLEGVSGSSSNLVVAVGAGLLDRLEGVSGASSCELRVRCGVLGVTSKERSLVVASLSLSLFGLPRRLSGVCLVDNPRTDCARTGAPGRFRFNLAELCRVGGCRDDMWRAELARSNDGRLGFFPLLLLRPLRVLLLSSSLSPFILAGPYKFRQLWLLMGDF